jgi:hypothetical protein
MVWQYMLGGAAQEQTTDGVNAEAPPDRQPQPVGLCSLPLVRLAHLRERRCSLLLAHNDHDCDITVALHACRDMRQEVVMHVLSFVADPRDLCSLALVPAPTP